jgi:hypothetical protein
MTRSRPRVRTGLYLAGAATGLLAVACGSAQSPSHDPAGAKTAGSAFGVTGERSAGQAKSASAPASATAVRPDTSRTASGSVTATPGPDALRSASPIVPPAKPIFAPAPGLPETGLYVDGPDGNPHYVISVSQVKGSSIAGSVNLIYQDGRTGLLSAYTAVKPSADTMTLALKTGVAVKATVQSHGFTIPGCARYLPFIDRPAQCTFTYHGDTP